MANATRLGMLQPSGRFNERWSVEKTRPPVRAHDEVLFRHFARVVVLLHFIGFTNLDDAPVPGGSHLVDFIAERTPTPCGANGDAREAETHDAPKPPSSASGAPLSLWRCPLTRRITEKELPETQTRWSPGFSWSTPGSPASTSISIDG